MNHIKLAVLKAIKPESCARMRKRLMESRKALFYGQVLQTNIYQAMGKL